MTTEEKALAAFSIVHKCKNTVIKCTAEASTSAGLYYNIVCICGISEWFSLEMAHVILDYGLDKCIKCSTKLKEAYLLNAKYQRCFNCEPTTV